MLTQGCTAKRHSFCLESDPSKRPFDSPSAQAKGAPLLLFSIGSSIEPSHFEDHLSSSSFQLLHPSATSSEGQTGSLSESGSNNRSSSENESNKSSPTESDDGNSSAAGARNKGTLPTDGVFMSDFKADMLWNETLQDHAIKCGHKMSLKNSNCCEQEGFV